MIVFWMFLSLLGAGFNLICYLEEGYPANLVVAVMCFGTAILMAAILPPRQ